MKYLKLIVAIVNLIEFFFNFATKATSSSAKIYDGVTKFGSSIVTLDYTLIKQILLYITLRNDRIFRKGFVQLCQRSDKHILSFTHRNLITHTPITQQIL